MTAATPGREALIASVATSLEGRSFAYTQGEHHRKFASKIVDDVLRLAANPSSDPDAMNERRVEEDARLVEGVREACDRTESIIERALNCHWITVLDRAQLKATLRIALDTEVEAGGPYLNNGWNRHVD